MVAPRSWRTRTDPFDARWPEVEAMLREAPDLEAKTLLGCGANLPVAGA